MNSYPMLEAEAQGNFVREFHNTTNFDPNGLALFALLALILFVLDRRSALLPFVLLLALVSHAQRIVIVGLDFGFLRLLLLCGWARVLMRAEYQGLKLERFDALVLTSIVYCFAIASLRDGNFVRALGEIFDSIGIYLLCRILIRDWGDLDRYAKYAGVAALLIAPFFLIEWQTGRNYFSIIGGVPEYSTINHGRMRARGAFAHPLIAGCFWATMLPLMVARLWNPRTNRLFAAAGILAALAVVVGTASSTPVLTVVAAIGAACLLPARSYIRWICWGTSAVLLCLHVVMNAPVWHLIARIGVFGSSTGWHRFNLIDKFIRNFGEWAVMGTNSTSHWGHNLEDVTNAFVMQGVRGGFISLALYIAVFVLAFRKMGVLIRSNEGRPVQFAYAWALAVTLFTHVVAHFGVGYFAQMRFVLYATLAAVASIAPARAASRVKRRAPRAAEPSAGTAAALARRGSLPGPTPTTGRS